MSGRYGQSSPSPPLPSPSPSPPFLLSAILTEVSNAKCEAIPVTGSGGPQARGTSRRPQCLDSVVTDGGGFTERVKSRVSRDSRNVHFCWLILFTSVIALNYRFMHRNVT
jgi:hypothetical protein